MGGVATYLFLGWAGLAIAARDPATTAIWMPAGVALAALVLFGIRCWPLVLASAWALNVSHGTPALPSLAMASGSAIEAVIGAVLVERFAGGHRAFEHPRTILHFGIAAAVACAVSGAIGVTSLSIAGIARWPAYGSNWMTWWLANFTGDLVVAPVIWLLWGIDRRRWAWRRAGEGALLVCCGFAAGVAVFGGLIGASAHNAPIEVVCVPFVVWAAFRFGPREVALLMFALAEIAVWGTVRGFGPFARGSGDAALWSLQLFVAVMALTSAALAAVVAEQRRSETHLHEIAATDALTGLANYRRLLEVLRVEIARSDADARQFAVLFVDLDELKTINDRFGHLAGSRALCRVADTLRRSCRATDTAARFGGDEFAIVLPETSEAGAFEVARRVSERLADEHELPRVSVSAGVAMYPRDGATPATLLSAADQHLYQVKDARPAEKRVLHIAGA